MLGNYRICKVVNVIKQMYKYGTPIASILISWYIYDYLGIYITFMAYT